MRYAALVLALAGAALLTGCCKLISLNPFVAEGQAISDPAIEGTWKGTGKDDKGQIAIWGQDSTYDINVDADGKAMHFRGRLTRVGTAEFMDIASTEEVTLAVPVHVVVRLWPAAKTLKFVYLESDWLREQAKKTLATQESGTATLITTPGDPVVQFLKKFGADPRSYSDDPVELVKAQ